MTGDHVVPAPPFVIDDGHVAAIVDQFGAAIDAPASRVAQGDKNVLNCRS